MYQRILVPVDGSALTDRAIDASIGLARQLGAAITGFVAEQPQPSGQRPRAGGAFRLVEDVDAMTPEAARRVLDRFAAAARAAGVPFEGHHACVARVDEALLAEAEARGCDLIVMVSEGRGAFGEFLYGSQAKAVLSGSRLPLLVLH
ncbi:MAG TPA: universal stress protein [Rubrivivax sp.]|nr:universal stress protein [Burkholderiales bacterium]HNT39970.1 universal stress protein [Rubrivivax sp.]